MSIVIKFPDFRLDDFNSEAGLSLALKQATPEVINAYVQELLPKIVEAEKTAGAAMLVLIASSSFFVLMMANQRSSESEKKFFGMLFLIISFVSLNILIHQYQKISALKVLHQRCISHLPRS